MSSYCRAIRAQQLSDHHQIYHDQSYGFPPRNDHELFGKMLMEINQAGLSWDIVLKKKESIKAAYADFDIATIAQFNDHKIGEMLQNPGIIRMRAKINAAIYNAQKILELQQSHGSFMQWLNEQSPKPIEDWVKLFIKTFKFMGKETTKEFLLATGYLEGAHEHTCPVHSIIVKQKPRWIDYP
jgi:DNA-3-methyladenine glycosylase I